MVLLRPLDIEYFKYSIVSNRVFNTVFNTFFRNDNIDIRYSILFSAGIDTEYSLLKDTIGGNQYQYFFNTKLS